MAIFNSHVCFPEGKIIETLPKWKIDSPFYFSLHTTPPTRKKKKQLTKTFDSLIPPMIIMILAASTGEDQAIAVNVYVQGTAGPAVLQTNQGLSHTVGLVA